MVWLVNLAARAGSAVIWISRPLFKILSGGRPLAAAANLNQANSLLTFAGFLQGIGLGFLLDDDEEPSAPYTISVAVVGAGFAALIALLILGWKSLKKLK